MAGQGFFGFTYNTFCNSVCQPQAPVDVALGSGTFNTFQDCIKSCDGYATITLVNYSESSGACSCVFTGGNNIATGQPGMDCAVAQGSGVNGS